MCKPRTAAMLVPPLMVFAAILGIWLVLTYAVLAPDQRFLLPPPQDVLAHGLLRWSSLSEILDALLSTTKVALLGLAISMTIGVGIAIAMSQARWVERSLYPYAVILQTIPILAMVPLIGFWFGFDLPSRVVVCVLISLFPIITNTLFGLKSVEPGWDDLFALHHAGRLTRLLKLQLPAALPAMFTGFRISAGLSVVGAIVGDFFFRQGQPGIGRMLDIYRQNLQAEQLFTAVLFSSLLGLTVFWFFTLVGHRLIRSWHDSARPSTGR
jgi:NitT/TauT family transport system permease protein